MGSDRSKFKKVTSREYKLILMPDRFSNREEGAEALDDLIKVYSEKAGADFDRQDKEETRKTLYLDTLTHE